jgi:hypothetical protein
MKTQATKATQAKVRLHIARQRAMGERMIGDHDSPRWLELFVTAIMVVCVLVAESRGWI